MAQTTEERVLSVHHWTNEYFSLRTTRNAGFRFESGQFVMIGLPDPAGGRPLLRAYSVASAHYDEHLDFFSIKVPGGPLTSRLQHVQPGDTVLVGTRATGTLTLGNLLPGETLWLLATGTGLAPFLSVIQDPETYERFENVVITHTCRTVADLAYADFLSHELGENELFGEEVKRKLRYYPTVTREPFKTQGRVTPLLQSGQISRDLGLPEFNIERDRVMLCGSQSMLDDVTAFLEGLGFDHGNSGEKGHFLTERAFAPAR